MNSFDVTKSLYKKSILLYVGYQLELEILCPIFSNVFAISFSACLDFTAWLELGSWLRVLKTNRCVAESITPKSNFFLAWLRPYLSSKIKALTSGCLYIHTSELKTSESLIF